MHGPQAFLPTLALVLCVAAVTTVLFQRIRQPVVLGYLLAGMIVGPHVPVPLVADVATVHALSELGVILLMFSLGLDFSLPKLVRVGPTAGLVAAIQCSLMIWLGYVTGQLFGWTRLESFYVGALIAISSTTIVVKAFAEHHVSGKLAEIVFGVLIVEDLIAIFLLAVLTTLSSGTSLTAAGLAATAGRLVSFLALVLGSGLLIVPRLIRAVVRLGRPETTVVASVGLCFAFALVADAAGYSVALGAFLAGALVAESGEVAVVEHVVQPVRDIFAAIFFVAVGMLIDPALIAAHWGAPLVFTAVVVVGKLAGVAVGVFLTGAGIRAAVQAGMSLAQIGEFSFIIAGLGLSTGATREFVYTLAVAVSAVTTLLTPLLIGASDRVATLVDRKLPKPLQTFVALYGTWLERLRAAPAAHGTGFRVRRLSRFLLVDAAVLAGVVASASTYGPTLIATVAPRLGLPPALGRALLLAVTAVLCVPFGIGIIRCVQSLGFTLAVAALPPEERTRVDLADAPRRVLVVTLQLAVLLVVGAPLIAITQPFLPPFQGAAVFALALVALAIAFWRSATNLQGHARAAAEIIVEALRHQVAPRLDEHALDPLQGMLPGLGAPVALRLEPGSYAVGKTLAALNLRGLTAATVLAIVRPTEPVLVPTGHETLQNGDVLALAGTHEAIAAARRLLREGRPDAAAGD
jgi:CPA2 family monovalent cation:H+ antiporter-2